MTGVGAGAPSPFPCPLTREHDEAMTMSSPSTRHAACGAPHFALPLRCLVALSLLWAASCSPTERTVKYKPFFTGLAGAEFSGDKPVNPEGGRVDPSLRSGEIKSIVEKPDGSKLYMTYAPMQLFAHVEALLDENTPEADRAILDQLIDEHTKDHYRAHSQDPIGYIAYLHEN